MRILVCVPHFTFFSASGHRQRLTGLLDLLAGHELHLLLPDAVPQEERSSVQAAGFHFFKEPKIFSLRIPFLLNFSLHYLRKFKTLVREKEIDLVILDFPWTLPVFFRSRKQPLVYFSIGVESDFSAITLSHMKINIFPINILFRLYVQEIERLVCRRSSLIITMSKDDALTYQLKYGASPELLYPLQQPVAPVSPLPGKIALRERCGLSRNGLMVLFHGTWNHLPNRTAIESIREQIAPLAAAASKDLFFVIAGTDVPQFRTQNIVSLGFWPDLDQLISCADIAIVPVYEGAGVRMKIFDYFRLGIPVVSTKKGIEGIEVQHRSEAIITEDNAQAVVEAVLELASDPGLRVRLAQNALNYLAREHDYTRIKNELNARLKLL